MAITQGTVSIKIEMTGAGDGAKRVSDASKAIDELGKKGKGAAGELSGVGAQVDALKDKASGVNKLREGFEFMRANALFLGSAVTGVVGGLIALVSGFDDGAKAIKAWEENSKKLDESLQSTRGVIEDINRLLGKPPPDDFAAVGDKTLTEWQKVQKQINEASAAIAALRRDEQFAITQGGRNSGFHLSVLKLINRAEDDRNILLAEQGRLLEANNRSLSAQAGLASLLTGRLYNIGALGAAGSVSGAAVKPVRPSGGRREHTLREALLTGDQKAIDKAFAGSRDQGIQLEPGGMSDIDTDQITAITQGQERVQAYLVELARAREAADLLAADEGARNSVRALTSDVEAFTAALGQALPDMGAFSGALSEIASIWGNVGDSSTAVTTGLIQSIGAIAAAGAAQEQNDRKRAGLMSIVYLGLGLGLLAVPGMQAQGEGYIAGALVLGAVGIAGGGSGGGSRGSAPRSSTTVRRSETLGDGGAMTVNINAPWFGSNPQEGAAGLLGYGQRARGTGFERPRRRR